MSKARAKLNVEYERTKSAWWPTVRGSACPVVLTLTGKRVPVEKSPHHLRGRHGPLLCDTRFWLAVSQEGHQWIHSHVKIAQRQGWIAGPGEWGKIEP